MHHYLILLLMALPIDVVDDECQLFCCYCYGYCYWCRFSVSFHDVDVAYETCFPDYYCAPLPLKNNPMIRDAAGDDDDDEDEI